MSQQQTPSPAGPPEWVFKRVINPMMKFILRSPFHGLLSNGLGVITFTGRKTGKQFSTPVAYNWLDERSIMVFTRFRSRWWKNLENGETIYIRIRGKDYSAKPEIIRDNDIVWEYANRFMQANGGDRRRVGIMLGDDATDEQVREAARELLAVKLTFQEA